MTDYIDRHFSFPVAQEEAGIWINSDFFVRFFLRPAFSCERFNNIRVNTKGCTLLLATTVEDIQRKKGAGCPGRIEKAERQSDRLSWPIQSE